MMKIDQGVFYTTIAKYYNHIFPLNEEQIEFVQSNVGSLAGKTILDVGCSTGQLANRLAGLGAQVTGIDLNQEMIRMAQKDNREAGVKYMEGDMLELDSHFEESSLDALICFGNTLVHLDSIEEVARFLKTAFHLLKPGSKLMLQILNYDFILDEEIEELPLIDGPQLSFLRKYDLPEQEGDKIIFNTELVIKKSRDSLFHASRLLPLRKKNLHQLLEHYGFAHIRYYSA
ncbi:MAG TPA: class I SAM-dependent methyltransferase, partial [Sunxiuqinia sp.]|nr:class I SAM-dependent methyltransferase [Sunxiuqinia sp.]